MNSRYEGFGDHPSTNNGLESMNSKFKIRETFRRKLPLMETELTKIGTPMSCSNAMCTLSVLLNLSITYTFAHASPAPRITRANIPSSLCNLSPKRWSIHFCCPLPLNPGAREVALVSQRMLYRLIKFKLNFYDFFRIKIYYNNVEELLSSVSEFN